MHILIVVDMQNDFITGPLGTPEAVEIVPRIVEKVQSFSGRILFTRDTHDDHYLQTQEGTKLPIPHCIQNTPGWEICSPLEALRQEPPIDKPGFGSTVLAQQLKAYHQNEQPISSITLCGVCTDVCVISNALLLKAFLPEVPILVDSACCAGITSQGHKTALEAMRACQIEILA